MRIRRYPFFEGETEGKMQEMSYHWPPCVFIVFIVFYFEPEKGSEVCMSGIP